MLKNGSLKETARRQHSCTEGSEEPIAAHASVAAQDLGADNGTGADNEEPEEGECTSEDESGCHEVSAVAVEDPGSCDDGKDGCAVIEMHVSATESSLPNVESDEKIAQQMQQDEDSKTGASA